MAAAAAGAREAPAARGGIIDLRGWDFGIDGDVRLGGDWEFVWRRLDDPAPGPGVDAPATAVVTVPGPWNDVAVGGGPAGADGYATYRLTILCNNATGIGLLVPTANSAMRLHANGRVLGLQGSPGTTRESTRPSRSRQVIGLGDLSCPMRLVLHVSNFHHRLGGLVEAPRMGRDSSLALQRDRGTAFDMAAFGGLMVVGLVTLLFFITRPGDRTSLWLGLCCLWLGAYFALGRELAFERLAVLDAGWEIDLKLHALAWYLSAPLPVLFVRALYPGASSAHGLHAVLACSLAAAAAVLLLPARLHTYTAPFMQLVTLATAGWLVAILGRISWRQRSGWAALLAGMVVAYPVLVLDLPREDAALRYSAMAGALFAFIVAPAILLARRFAHALGVEELRAFEERHGADLVERATKAGLLDWRAEGVVAAYSRRFKEMLGYPADADASRWDFFEMVHPEDREIVRGLFHAQLRDRVSDGGIHQHAPWDLRLRRADGAYIWVHSEAVSIKDEAGRTLRYLSSFIDITEHRALAQALRNQSALTQAIVAQIPGAVFVKDREGRFTLANRGWSAMSGVPAEHAIGRTVHDLYPAETAKRFAAEDEKLLAQGAAAAPLEVVHEGPGQGQFRIVRKVVLSGSDGSVQGLVCTSTDITRLKEYEAQLADRAKFIDELVDALPVSIALRDTEGRFLQVNRTWERYFNLRREDALGKRISELPGWQENAELVKVAKDAEQIDRDVIARGPAAEPMQFERTRLGRTFLSSRQVIADTTGRTVGVLATGLDTTERHAMEEALRQSVRLREEVERMSRHDLKTPLNSVIAMSRLLREGARVAPEDAELLGIIERAGYRILNMVNLSLDLFRMETGTYQFHPQAVDLAEVARRVAADLESQAASKNIDVRVRANGVSAATQEVLARGDELLCYSMFANLVKNAIEASPPGGTVSILLHRSDTTVVAEVHNPGAVPEEMRGRFFRKYATTGKSAGLGLGTYSAQLMARVQDGELSLESSEAAGTTLVVRMQPAAADLPRSVESRAAAGASEAASEALPPHKVLVVDDDEFNRLVLRRYLPVPPLSVEFAVNGRAALEAAQREWPDVVLLDLEMPVMDGYEAARKLREMERARGLKRCLIVAISSNDQEAIVQRALAAGCDQYVVKPVPRRLLWSLLGGPGAAAPAEAAVPRASDAVVVDADLRHALPEFLSSRAALLDDMPKVLAAGDRVQFKRLAHRLAGSFALFGFKWAAAQARAIEADALQGDAAQLGERAAALRAYLDRVNVEFAPLPAATGS